MTSKKTTRNNKPAQAPLGESVTRYGLLGACDITLIDPGAQLPPEARQALFDIQKKKSIHCVMQCEGYVFNFIGLPFVTFVDKKGNITGTSVPTSKDGTNTTEAA